MDRVPSLPEAFRERGWRTSFSDSAHELDLPFFSIVSHSVVFEGPDAGDLGELMAVDADVGPRSIFATALEFRPSLSDLGIDPASVFGPARRHARREFADSVRGDGLVGVTRTDARWIERDDGTRARAFRYEVGTPLDRRVVFGNRAGEADEPFTLRGRLWAAIWPTEGAYAMAGGIYPTETLEEAADRQAPGIPVVADHEFDVDPEAHRKELARAMQSIGT